MKHPAILAGRSMNRAPPVDAVVPVVVVHGVQELLFQPTSSTHASPNSCSRMIRTASPNIEKSERLQRTAKWSLLIPTCGFIIGCDSTCQSYKYAFTYELSYI